MFYVWGSVVLWPLTFRPVPGGCDVGKWWVIIPIRLCWRRLWWSGWLHLPDSFALNCHLLELLGDFLQGPVDVELRSPAEGLLAQRTVVRPGGPASTCAASFSVPVGADAALAVAVAAWRWDRVVEQIQADGARELVLRQAMNVERHRHAVCSTREKSRKFTEAVRACSVCEEIPNK